MSNKLVLPGEVWLASDIHLGPDTPETWAQFANFLKRAAREANALIIGGDLFDAWIGDDVALQSPPNWLIPVLDLLAETGQQTQLYLARGNRDFLVGQTLCKRIHATLLPEPALIETSYGTIVFTHGDELCTDDHAYQRFRRIVRNPLVQKIFFWLSIPLRERIARIARQRSMKANTRKSREIMDVNETAVANMFTQYSCAILVHGHTHRPAINTYNQGQNGLLKRIVLPDWDYDHEKPHRGGWLHINANKLELVSATRQTFPTISHA